MDLSLAVGVLSIVASFGGFIAVAMKVARHLTSIEMTVTQVQSNVTQMQKDLQALKAGEKTALLLQYRVSAIEKRLDISAPDLFAEE